MAGKKDEKVEEDAAIVGPEPEADGGWGSFGTKNKKKGANKAVEPAFTKEVEPDPKPDDEWGAFSTKKDKKKTKKSAWDESEKEEKSIVEGTPNLILPQILDGVHLAPRRARRKLGSLSGTSLRLKKGPLSRKHQSLIRLQILDGFLLARRRRARRMTSRRRR